MFESEPIARGIREQPVLYANVGFDPLTTFDRWRQKRIRLKTLRRPQRLVGGGLVLEDVSCGELEVMENVDTLIGIVPPRAVHALEAPPVAAWVVPALIGDCHAPRSALKAIFEGQRTARALSLHDDREDWSPCVFSSPAPPGLSARICWSGCCTRVLT